MKRSIDNFSPIDDYAGIPKAVTRDFNKQYWFATVLGSK
jgi:hypothetical protein